MPAPSGAQAYSRFLDILTVLSFFALLVVCALILLAEIMGPIK